MQRVKFVNDLRNSDDLAKLLAKRGWLNGN
jgi:hypothetical protein